MRLRCISPLALAATLVLALSSRSVDAHERDAIVVGKSAGPMAIGETTLAEAEQWFGEPGNLTSRRYGCIRVVRAVWPGLRLTFSQQLRRLVEIEIRSEEINSTDDGTLRFHTPRGLSVGDTILDVQQKYPDAPFYMHDLHIHHVLHLRFPVGRVEATTRLGSVTELLVAPWELC